MSIASDLIAQPDAELEEVLVELPRISAASKSEARWDRECSDGSVLVVTSRDGEPCEMYAVDPPPAPVEDPPPPVEDPPPE